MSDQKKRRGSTTQMGHPGSKKGKSDPSLADTLPNVQRSQIALPGVPGATDSDSLVTSAPLRTLVGKAQASGAVTLTGERVAEELARELIASRMGSEGFTLQPDFAFSYGDLLVTLDGFDPERMVGFQYVSHADADVVTDIDSSVEERLHELAAAGVVNVLIIHDHDATTGDKVVERVESFLASL